MKCPLLAVGKVTGTWLSKCKSQLYLCLCSKCPPHSRMLTHRHVCHCLTTLWIIICLILFHSLIRRNFSWAGRHHESGYIILQLLLHRLRSGLLAGQRVGAVKPGISWQLHGWSIVSANVTSGPVTAVITVTETWKLMLSTDDNYLSELWSMEVGPFLGAEHWW